MTTTAATELEGEGVRPATIRGGLPAHRRGQPRRGRAAEAAGTGAGAPEGCLSLAYVEGSDPGLRRRGGLAGRRARGRPDTDLTSGTTGPPQQALDEANEKHAGPRLRRRLSRGVLHRAHGRRGPGLPAGEPRYADVGMTTGYCTSPDASPFTRAPRSCAIEGCWPWRDALIAAFKRARARPAPA